MIFLQWFWFLLMVACLVWYSTITFYVAIHGVSDIKEMLANLAESNKEEQEKA